MTDTGDTSGIRSATPAWQGDAPAAAEAPMPAINAPAASTEVEETKPPSVREQAQARMQHLGIQFSEIAALVVNEGVPLGDIAADLEAIGKGVTVEVQRLRTLENLDPFTGEPIEPHEPFTTDAPPFGTFEEMQERLVLAGLDPKTGWPPKPLDIGPLG